MTRIAYSNVYKKSQLARGFTKPWGLVPWARRSSSFAHLHAEMTSRRLPLLYDTPHPLPSYLLSTTLSDFLPPLSRAQEGGPGTSIWSHAPPPMPAAHHLIYFPPPSRISALLDDGTDPDQSPGDPFVRRMWAGGRINFFPSKDPSFKLIGRKAVCLERIRDVVVKGPTRAEKIFVTIERRVNRIFSKSDDDTQRQDFSLGSEDSIRQGLMDDAHCSVIETRDIVFMRQNGPAAAAHAPTTPGKIVKPPFEPTFSHILTPTAALLFRFSALTFNAHRIHLDRQYCQDTEGHRNLLVHGPLSLVLMTGLLERHLAGRQEEPFGGSKEQSTESIVSIEYRNLAPLYAEEEMRVCGRARRDGEWDVWIEGRDGGYAVKGTVKTGETAPVELPEQSDSDRKSSRDDPKDMEAITIAS